MSCHSGCEEAGKQLEGLGVNAVILVLAVCVFLAISGASASAVELAADGNPKAEIVLPPGADETTRFAGGELQSYLRRISGATLEIVTAPSGRVAYEIRLGEACRQLAPGLPPPARYPEDDQFALKLIGDHLCIAGCSSRATLFGVYAFLERLGCRWFAPAFAHYEGHHEVVPEKSTIRIDRLDVVELPDFRYRGAYIEHLYSDSPVEDMAAIGDWLAKVRKNCWALQHNLLFDFSRTGAWHTDLYRKGLKEAVFSTAQERGLTLCIGGHGFSTFLPPKMYFDEHPEWFAMIAGERVSRDMNAQFCISNEAALDTYVEGVMKHMAANPWIDILRIVPNDGWGWCECDACKALGEPSEQYLALVKAVADRMAKKYPEKFVQMIAYLHTTAPPPEAEFPSNMTVWYAHFNRDWRYPLDTDKSHRDKNADHFRNLRAWLQTGLRVISESHYRKYYFRSLPAIKPHLMELDFPRLAEIGVPDIFLNYMEPLDWAGYELSHYAHARFAWDAGSSADDIVRDFCRHRYGDAAEAAFEFLSRLESAMNEYQMPGDHQTNRPDALQRAEAHLEAAQSALGKARAKAADEPARFHLRRNALMLEYARLENTMNLHAAGKQWDEALAVLDKEEAFLRAHLHDGMIVPADAYVFDKLKLWRRKLMNWRDGT